MDEQNEYNKFKEFLTGFFIRKAEGTLTNDDFDEKQSEYIWPHLENILSRLSLPEAMRVATYFKEALSFHIKGQPTQASLQKPQSSRTITARFDSELQPFKRPRLMEADIPKENNQVETPNENFTSIRRETVGMMQSTPLSIPTAAETLMRINLEQPEYSSVLEDPFINDIMTHINLSPIPQESENQPVLSDGNVTAFTHANPTSIRNIEDNEHQFLRNFAHMMGERETNREKNNRFKEQRKSVKQLNTAATLLNPPRKAKRKKIPFEVICCWRSKEVNESAEESFLYFPMMPRRMKNLIKRMTDSARLGRSQSHIPKDKIMNLSNVMRAYASERQSSVELPAQVSFLPSPCTPQSILRTSQLQPFTPIFGDGTCQLLGLETEQTNFHTRPLLRQQPLLTIPERDSLMQQPIGSVDEEVSFRNSLSSIAQPSENVLANQLDIDENMDLAAFAENVGEINLEAQPSIHIGSPNLLPTLIEQHELSVQNESIVHNQADDAHINWFDILRPRLDMVYPRVQGEKRKRKKRKRTIEEDEGPSCPSPEIQEAIPANSPSLPMILGDISEPVTQYPAPGNLTQLEHGLKAYINLLKEGIQHPERTWEHFDPFLFSENDDFEMYTNIFKRILTEDFVSMSTLYKEGTSRLDAAKGFRLLLELQTMGLIEFAAIGTHIESFKYRPPNEVEGG